MSKSYNPVSEIFTDKKIISKIQNKLPELFQIAELESSRAGKIGMEVGSLREKIIIALLIYQFRKENVNTSIPITEPEKDVIVKNVPYSIKTITGNSRVKAVWTVDASSANNFINKYKPGCHMLLIRINWEGITGGVYLIPIEVQEETCKRLGKERYLDLPKPGTNPRGVEFAKEAIEKMLSNKETLKIEVTWKKKILEYDAYKRWVDYWKD